MVIGLPFSAPAIAQTPYDGWFFHTICGGEKSNEVALYSPDGQWFGYSFTKGDAKTFAAWPGRSKPLCLCSLMIRCVQMWLKAF
jgi:hypothetical protein